jgi:hypothetical protein
MGVGVMRDQTMKEEKVLKVELRVSPVCFFKKTLKGFF